MPSATQQTEVTEYDSGLDEITREMATPKLRQNPYPLYARMRREHPVYRSSQGIWYLTRYADVEAALHDLRLSSDRERALRAWAARRGVMERVSRLGQRMGRSMISADPPDHTRLRRLVNKAFTARRVQGLRPRIETIGAELLDAAIAAGPTMDLIAALAYPLPITVICELLGVPRSDRGRIRAWSRLFVDEAMSPYLTEEGIGRAELAVEEFEGYLRALIRKRRTEPADDILSALVTVAERGNQHDGRLTDDELVATCFLLLVAGHETTINLIGNGTLTLLRHPDQLRRLQQDPTLIRPAVEELLRYDSPVQAVSRVVTEPLEIGGCTLSDGDLVLPMLGAANHDPDRFGGPDRLDLGRRDNRHLSFGNGSHFCLGAPLARLEGEVAIGAIVGRLPRLRLDTDNLQWRPSVMLRGLEALPLAY